MTEKQSSRPEEPRGTVGRAFDAPYDDDVSAVGPTDVDADDWAERERRRRRAWLDGPSEDERIAWARRERRRRSSGSRSGEDPEALGPSDEEIQAWADRE